MSLFEIELDVELPGFPLAFRLDADERTVGVFGPSGAGKTTVVEHVAGWRHGARGHVRVDGRTLFDSDAGVDVPAQERGIGYVPQDVLLFPHWSARRNVLAGRERARPGAAIDPDEVVATLELEPLLDRPVQRLSGGERHRVALARALCSQPTLLLLDEPLASLDLRLRRRILADLVRVRDEFGVPMLFISHDPTEVQVLCDRVQCLERGRITAEGDPSEVLGTSREAEYENVLRGVVGETREHTARVRLASGHELVAPRAGAATGDAVVLGLRGDDVLLAIERPRGISARNLLDGHVHAIEETAGPVVVAVALDGEGAPTTVVRVHVTRSAVRDLGLDPGTAVTLITKTHSIEVLARVPRGAGA